MRRCFQLVNTVTFLFSSSLAFLAPAARAQDSAFKSLPVTVYDFDAAHPDFQNASCGGGGGMVQRTLDADRKPFHQPGNSCAENGLATWFRSSPDNTAYCKSLRMSRKPGTASTYEYESKFFFPIDSVPTNEGIYAAGDGKIHNFHFCMEMKGAFRYKGGEVFDFVGDDDVWVFINNRLALDLGGVHGAKAGTVRLDVQKDNLGIRIGELYNFDFFFCERQTESSTLKVTTDIEIVPPTAGEVHISDAGLSVLGAGDTLTLPKGGGARVFKALQDWYSTRNEGCTDVPSQGREPAAGEWTLGDGPLPAGASATVDPEALPYGLHRLTFRKEGFTASVWILVPGEPPRPLVRAVGGYYQDLDGDGRIETAVLRFDSNFLAPPAGLRFTDPFGKAVHPPASLRVAPQAVIASLPPFAPGTGFPASELAAIAAEPGAYADQAVVLEDSVGPVLQAAHAFPAADPAARAALEVEFSEAVPLDVTAPAFPFDLKRGTALVGGTEVRVAALERLSPTRYRLTFLPGSGSRYPVPGDSLRIRSGAGVRDAGGAPSRMAFYVPVSGDPLLIRPSLEVALSRGVTDGPAIRPLPDARPVVIHGGNVCANCGDPGLRPLLPDVAPALIPSLGPTWDVKTEFPFHYALTVFDNLGQFVNAAEGDLSPEGFEAIRAGQADPDSVTVRLTFLPVSRSGQVLASGAYILKGTLWIREQPGLKGGQGEAVKVVPVERAFVSRFGYLRKP